MEIELDLPEDLLMAATAEAAARGLTLNAFVEQCLREELASTTALSPGEHS